MGKTKNHLLPNVSSLFRFPCNDVFKINVLALPIVVLPPPRLRGCLHLIFPSASLRAHARPPPPRPFFRRFTP